jgi:hypothetical protein
VIRWLCASLLVAACGTPLAQSVDKDIVGFVPDDARLVSRLDADVTGDGVADTILVSTSEKDPSATVTVLMRPHGRSLTDRRQTDALAGVDALKLELSPLGPPTVKAVKGILIVEHLVGGAFVRTEATYKYRFNAEEGRMQLIGMDAKRTSSTLTMRLSYNALTGVRIFKNGNEPESKRTEKPSPVWMDLTSSADREIDLALGAKGK